MEANFARAGGCLCGNVRVAIAKPASQTYHCHCSMCRRVTGSLYQTFSVYPADAIRIIAGADTLRTYVSSPGVDRRFCGNCGCQVLCEDASMPGIILINSGVLDGGGHPGHPPEREQHIYVADKVPWLHLDDRLPRVDQAP